jgi:DNA-binding CsgD family transcriptional regulator
MTRSSLSDPAQRIELTERQEAVVRLIAKGLTNAEIADRLGVTLNGVKWHVREILGKFGVDSREQAVERWREERATGRRSRAWAGALWGSIPLRWAGVALAGGAGLTGAVAFAGAFSERGGHEDGAALVATATPTPTPIPDLATNQGLTLRVERVSADDTQTRVEVSLEGRPELGRIFDFESKVGPGPDIARVRLVDDAGATYNASVTESDGDARRKRLLFGPVSPDTRWLDLIVPGVSFVAPEDEPALGEPPPEASSSVGGPWRVRIHEIPRTSVVRHALDLAPQALGQGTAVPFEVIQTAEATLLAIQLQGIDGPDHGGFVPFPELRRPNGDRVPARNSGSRSNPTTNYASYEPTHGEVTFKLRAHIIIGLPDNVCTLSDQHCVPREEIERMRPEVEGRRAALEALFAQQGEPTWTFTIP